MGDFFRFAKGVLPFFKVLKWVTVQIMLFLPFLIHHLKKKKEKKSNSSQFLNIFENIFWLGCIQIISEIASQFPVEVLSLWKITAYFSIPFNLLVYNYCTPLELEWNALNCFVYIYIAGNSVATYTFFFFFFN